MAAAAATFSARGMTNLSRLRSYVKSDPGVGRGRPKNSLPSRHRSKMIPNVGEPDPAVSRAFKAARPNRVNRARSRSPRIPIPMRCCTRTARSYPARERRHGSMCLMGFQLRRPASTRLVLRRVAVGGRPLVLRPETISVQKPGACGVSESVAMTLSGHLTPSIFHRYNITSSANQVEAVRKLAAIQASPAETRRAEAVGMGTPAVP